MKLIIRFALITITLSLPAVAALAQGFTPELFKQFVEMRVGTGEPVYWYCVDRYADLPATMRGYLEKSARMWMQPPRDPEEIRQLQKGVPQANASSN